MTATTTMAAVEDTTTTTTTRKPWRAPLCDGNRTSLLLQIIFFFCLPVTCTSESHLESENHGGGGRLYSCRVTKIIHGRPSSVVRNGLASSVGARSAWECSARKSLTTCFDNTRREKNWFFILINARFSDDDHRRVNEIVCNRPVCKVGICRMRWRGFTQTGLKIIFNVQKNMPYQ